VTKSSTMSNTQANRLRYLLDQFAANTMAEPEFAELMELMGQDGREEEIKAALLTELEVQRPGKYNRLYWAEQFRKLNLEGQAATPVRHIGTFWKKIAVAASILLVLGLSAYLFTLRAANAEPILTASERYVNKDDCKKAIGICQKNSPGRQAFRQAHNKACTVLFHVNVRQQ